MTARGSEAPAVSVVVLNHRRPQLLRRVLEAVRQLDHPRFEVIVVGDQPDLAAYGLPSRLTAGARYACCTEANICRARNAGVAMAAGEIVAFVDDDAVPEPDWLSELVVPFALPGVGAAGGRVRAADGLSWEWQGGVFDRAATEFPMTLDAASRIFPPAEQIAQNRFLSLRGVNSAFRRGALLAAGGFDESYRYYLDETDMALRLAEDGWSTALVRGAEVHHLPEPNAVRGTLRCPRNLFEVAASKAYFCKRHLPERQVDAQLAAFRAARLRDLDPHLRLGLLRRADRGRLARQLEEGIAHGLGRTPILPLRGGIAASRGGSVGWTGAVAGPLRIALVTAWGPLEITRLRAVARRLAAGGHGVSCFSFMTGAHRPSVTFRDGIWLHTGGTWRFRTPAGRTAIGRAAIARGELARVAGRRHFDVILRPAAVSADGLGSRMALLPVPGLARPLSVERTARCTLSLVDVVQHLRRALDIPEGRAAAVSAPVEPDVVPSATSAAANATSMLGRNASAG